MAKSRRAVGAPRLPPGVLKRVQPGSPAAPPPTSPPSPPTTRPSALRPSTCIIPLQHSLSHTAPQNRRISLSCAVSATPDTRHLRHGTWLKSPSTNPPPRSRSHVSASFSCCPNAAEKSPCIPTYALRLASALCTTSNPMTRLARRLKFPNDPCARSTSTTMPFVAPPSSPVRMRMSYCSLLATQLRSFFIACQSPLTSHTTTTAGREPSICSASHSRFAFAAAAPRTRAFQKATRTTPLAAAAPPAPTAPAHSPPTA